MLCLVAIFLFIILSPGLFLRIPTKGPLFIAVLVHATVFAAVLYLYKRYIPEGFYNFVAPKPLSITLNNDDMAPMTVVGQMTSERSGVLTFPGGFTSNKPLNVSFNGNTLGNITFPPGINLPRGEYMINVTM